MLLTILKSSWYDSYGYDRRSYSLTSHRTFLEHGAYLVVVSRTGTTLSTSDSPSPRYSARRHQQLYYLGDGYKSNGNSR